MKVLKTDLQSLRDNLHEIVKLMRRYIKAQEEKAKKDRDDDDEDETENNSTSTDAGQQENN